MSTIYTVIYQLLAETLEERILSRLFVVGSKEKYTFSRLRLNTDMAYMITITQWTADLLLSSKASIFKEFLNF